YEDRTKRLQGIVPEGTLKEYFNPFSPEKRQALCEDLTNHHPNTRYFTAQNMGDQVLAGCVRVEQHTTRKRLQKTVTPEITDFDVLPSAGGQTNKLGQALLYATLHEYAKSPGATLHCEDTNHDLATMLGKSGFHAPSRHLEMLDDSE